MKVKSILVKIAAIFLVAIFAVDVQAQLDSTKVGVDIENDSVYSYALNHYATSGVSLNNTNKKQFILFRGYKEDKNFWLGTASLAVASGFYIAAAWSDPVVYIESHNVYTRDYFNKAIKKRNAKIFAGVGCTVVAAYFFNKLRKKKSRWGVGPDGIKYTF